MLLTILGIVFPVFAVIAAGWAYGRKIDTDMSVANRVNLDLFVPALVFSVLSEKDFLLGEYGALTLAAIAVVLGSGVVAWGVARLLGYQWRTFVPPMMFSNSGNMGLPLALFAFGPAGLPIAVVLFLVENLTHFSLGVLMLDRRANLLNIFKVPMVAASIAGIVVSLLGIPIWAPLAEAIKLLGQISIPLLLFALGVRLVGMDFSHWRIGVWGGLVCPLSGLLSAWLAVQMIALPADQIKQLWLFAALPPAVLNYMVAERYTQEPARVAAIVMIGNVMSVAIIPLALYFIL